MATTTNTPKQKKSGPNRRQFLSTAAGAFTFGFFLSDNPRLDAGSGASFAPNAYITIGADESITISFGGCEMGQGAMTGLPQIIADQLFVDWTKVIVQTALNSPISYSTGGSSAVRGRIATLQNAGATVREWLILAAMKTLGDSNRANYTVASGIITNTAQNKSASYGSLVTVAPTVGPPTGVTPIPGKLLGTTVPRVDIPLKTDGSAIFGLDVRIPGMVYAVIKHAPFGGTLRSTPSVPKGATAVVAISAPDNRGAVVKGSKNAVAVVSDNTWDAMQAASNLQASWNSAPAGSNVDSTALATLAATLMTSGTPLQAEVVGLTPSTAEAGVAAALQNASKKINVTYSLPFLAHATLEVLNCTVNITPATSTTPPTSSSTPRISAADWGAKAKPTSSAKRSRSPSPSTSPSSSSTLAKRTSDTINTVPWRSSTCRPASTRRTISPAGGTAPWSRRSSASAASWRRAASTAWLPKAPSASLTR
jgi:isoquinoline 1-oxidoreductase beta subunit